MLKQKRVSIAMIYHRDGEILWHRGRHIQGRSIHDGDFCKSLIIKSIEEGGNIEQENIYITYSGDGISESAERLRIKSVYIQPILDNFFLYVDSGTQMSLSDSERDMLRMLGGLLSEAIWKIKKAGESAGGITGQSDAIKDLRERALKFSLEEDCVLILGETGVGKTHLAQLIHAYSGRKGQFVVADTTTINESLFESVIFGHRKGSFTGAVDNRRGLIDEAEDGTLFFDEIAEVPVSFQAKLLRFIESKKYRVLGEPVEKTANVRILAATNRDLKQQIHEKLFREDLFYRLNILTLNLPSLRERKEDIKKIVEENREFLKGKEIGAGFWEAVLNYDWPGNFRELFAVLKRVGILCEPPVTGKDIESMIDKQNIPLDEEAGGGIKDKIRKELEEGKGFWEVVKEPFMNREINRGEVAAVITWGLEKADWSYVNALPFFNIHRSEYKKFMKFIHNNKIKLGRK